MWKLKQTAEGKTRQANAELAKEKLLGLKKEIPQIKRIEVGINTGQGEQGFDLILISEFKTKKDLEEYQAHPKHKIVSDFISKIRTERVFIDYAE